MKNIKTRSKSSLFLMELIIVLMFFSLSAAICMKVFAISKVKTDTARDLAQASFAAESFAEVYKEYNGDMGKVGEYYSVNGATSDTKKMVFFYDKEWNRITDGGEAVYSMNIATDRDKNLLRASIKVAKVEDGDGDAIIEIVAATTKAVGSGEAS